MKLFNRSLIYLSLVFFFIIGIWSVIFYFNLKDEIRDSIDDGLDNNKILILQKVKSDSTLLLQNEFGGNNFKIQPVAKPKSYIGKDIYIDTLMYRQNEADLEPVRLLHSTFECKGIYYQLTVISSLVEEDDLIEDSFWSVVWLFLILITSIFIVNNVIIRKIWNPFYNILNRLKTYRLDQEEDPINVETKTKEFIQLQDASNLLIHYSKEAYISQKQFIENASHELQTPIAIIMDKLELLLESENLTEKDAKTIDQVINIADRLKKINNALLLLTKIENKQFPEQISVSINKITTELLSNYQDFIEFNNIDLKIETTSDLHVRINSSLAEVLISNLIKNSIFHNKKNGNISVKITEHEFIIFNSGKTSALDPKTIFNRFEKDQIQKQNMGLGLAVSKAICNSYGISITYLFLNNEHCFTIKF